MGIDTQAAIILGYSLDELNEAGIEDPIEWIEAHDFSSVAPYYDADRDDRLFGIVLVGTYPFCAQEFDFSCLVEGVPSAERKLLNLTGIKPKIYLTPNVW